MNNQPVSYFQTDPKWKNKPYAVKGEGATIGGSGCGPTSMAMVLATWADSSVTPETECAWALRNGYKAYKQGTYYSYFVPAAKRYGLICTQVNSSSIYGNANAKAHNLAKGAVDSGDLVIACMGKGLWTSSGHYVLVWKIEGNMIYINDPASTKIARTHGNYLVFKQQVKYYWIIRRPAGKKEEPDMTEKEVKIIIDNLSDEAAYNLYLKAMRHLAAQPESDWSKREGLWLKAKNAKITDGSRPMAPMTREEGVAILGRLGMIRGDANETARELGMD